jgi:predicted MPP superfamily phosphohydrolase
VETIPQGVFGLRKFFVIFLSTIILLAVFLYGENNLVAVNYLTLNLDNLPAAFTGLKIVHLSDLHGKSFGKEQRGIVQKVKAAQPDLVVFTGDLIDRRHGGAKAGLELLDRLAKIAPVYYVTGNHEGWAGTFDTLRPQLEKRNVKVLSNTHHRLQRGEDSIYILGIDDPAFQCKSYRQGELIRPELKAALEGTDSFTILLAHRPELIETYSHFGIDLVFSGHAHGGQIRLPFIGGLVAPGQGFFPRYTNGFYTHGSSVLVVSRGLGNSVFPQRLFNRPEIVVVTLNRS